MQNSRKPSVSQQELDNLLKQAFLNLDLTHPKTTHMMETVANHTLTTPVPLTGSSSSFFSLKWIIAVVSMLSVLVLFFLYIIDVRKEGVVAMKTPDPITQSPEKTTMILTDSVPEKNNKVPSLINNSRQENKQSSTPKTSTEPAPVQAHEKPDKSFVPAETKQSEDSAFVFPVLTDEEIKANHKRKEKMISQSLKYSKDKYARASKGSKQQSKYQPRHKIPSITYMQITEVSNVEYKTFLFDLLIKGDKATFLLAKPVQSLWNTIYDAKLGSYYKDNYFSDKKYNDMPVVNVSWEGAELYCQWLQAEAEKVAIEKDISFLRTYTLPNDQEWGYAAQGGKGNVDYPWGGPHVRNPYGVYLANICLQKSPDKLEPEKNAEYTTAGLGLKDATALTASVNSFTVNDYGFYNMSGNVAEFVKDYKTQKKIIKGGSWNSSLEEAKIDHKESVVGSGASPYNGFRMIIHEIDSWMIFSYQEATDSDFVFPKPTRAEVKENTAHKQKMIRQLSAYQKDKYAFVPMGSCFYQGRTVSAEAFYMYTTEVSNAEYKTFLMDLVINGRKEEFLKCLPDQTQWTKRMENGYLEPMQNMYFAHPAYDDYPVLTVSRAQAEAYCLWLTIEVNKQQAAGGKPAINDVRLPSDVEWALAASNKKNRVKYANGTDSLKNEKGKYLQNYGCWKMEALVRDPIHDVYNARDTSRKEHSFIADGGFTTTYIRSYSSNLYGIYGLAGNVSEMVYLWDTETNRAKGFGTKGGNWFSADYFLEIDADQEFINSEKASPFVGFRPVVSAVKK